MENTTHFTGVLEYDKPTPDGNTGGMLLKVVIERAGKTYVLPTGLPRPVNQAVVVKANRTIGIPYFALDNSGNEINEAGRVGLVFTNILEEMPVTVHLRFA